MGNEREGERETDRLNKGENENGIPGTRCQSQ